MRIVVTAGPSSEPLDEVRRLTNFSTGELGTLLSEYLVEAGHSVTCFRGAAACFAAPHHPVEVVPFNTNDDLDKALQAIPARQEVAVVFHAAALNDFRVKEIVDEKGNPISGRKLSSRDGNLQLTLEPAPKLIATMRRLFPASILIGWKYELDGTPDDVRARGRAQMDECLTDACVLNGKAYGTGFGVTFRSGEQVHLPDKAALCRFLLETVEKMPVATNSAGEQSFHALSSFTSLSPFI